MTDEKRRRPTVLGTEVPSRRPPGESERLHGEHEARSSGDFTAAMARRRRAREDEDRTPASRRTYPEVVHESDDPPRSSRGNDGRKGVFVPQWALGVAFVVTTVLTAVGGVPGIKSLIQEVKGNPPASAEQTAKIEAGVQRVEAKVNALGEAQAANEKRDAARWQRNDRRWDLTVAFGCRLNGKKPIPWAFGQDCYPTEQGRQIVWETPPLGQNGPRHARFEWPQTPSQ